jgi:cystathionine beta-lyase family protein involved in aluminum resistance
MTSPLPLPAAYTAADVPALIESAEKVLSQDIWPSLDATQYTTFDRVLEAFRTHRVGEEHFYSVSGYGHNDLGREVTDRVFADALEAEAALVRLQMVSGTHALAVALNGVLRHGDRMVCLTGRPYDTLEEVIGLRGDDRRSLIAQGVEYREFSVFSESGGLQLALSAEIEAAIRGARMVYLQRSRGYSLRKTLRIDDIAALVQRVKAISPETVVMVDNCYGEFIESHEPTFVGVDLVAGSLIKNPGGGLAPTGGYVAGRADLVSACASVLTCPGVGSEGGMTFDATRTLLQGLFLAPTVVKEALRGMSLAAWCFERLGYEVTPRWDDPRGDIIQTLRLGNPETLIRFCRMVQAASPVSSALTPVPAQVPSYADAIIMAGGTFIDGSSIELSADAPLREPYVAYLQGGITYAHTRNALRRVLEALLS